MFDSSILQLFHLQIPRKTDNKLSNVQVLLCPCSLSADVVLFVRRPLHRFLPFPVICRHFIPVCLLLTAFHLIPPSSCLLSALIRGGADPMCGKDRVASALRPAAAEGVQKLTNRPQNTKAAALLPPCKLSRTGRREGGGRRE